MCSKSLDIFLVSKSFETYLNHVTLSPQIFAKSSTHQKTPFLEGSIMGYGLLVHSSPKVYENSNISTMDEGMFLQI